MELFELKELFFQLLREQELLRINAKAEGEKFKREHKALDEKLGRIDAQIHENFKWQRFIDYCNTPCWRYTC